MSHPLPHTTFSPTQGRVARADLLRLLATCDHPIEHLSWACSAQVAQDVGYWRVPVDENHAFASMMATSGIPSASAGIVNPAPEPQTVQQLAHMWMVTEHTPSLTHAEQAGQQLGPLEPLTEHDAQAPSTAPPPDFEDLVPRARLMPLLMRLMHQRCDGVLDLPRVVQQISQRQVPRHWPRKAHSRWPEQLIVVLDFSDHLYPFHQDMHRLCHWLTAVFGRASLSLRIVEHGPCAKWTDWHAHQLGSTCPMRVHDWQTPPAGSAVLVVSDFALTLPHSAMAVRGWHEFGEDLLKTGCKPFALVPLGAQQIPPILARTFALVRWSPDAPAQPQRQPMAQDDWATGGELAGLAPLLAMISSTRRVDPPLLRALRQLNPLAPRNAGLEAVAWNHPDVEAGSACWVNQEKTQAHQKLFADKPAWHQPVRSLTAVHHGHLRAGLNHEEVLRWAGLLTPEERDLPANQNAIQQAIHFFRRMLGTLAKDSAAPDNEKWWRYADRLVWGTEAAARQQAPDLFKRLVELLAPKWLASKQTSVPTWVDPRWLDDGTAQPPLPYWLVHDFASGHPLLQPHAPQPRQSLLAGPIRAAALKVQAGPDAASAYVLHPTGQTVRLAVPGVSTPLTLHHDDEVFTLAHVPRPTWASEWGQDRAGPYALCLDLFDQPRRLSPLANDEQVFQEVGRFRYSNDQYGRCASLLVSAQTQSFRYIPPGQFLMGSPDNEPERVEDEGPQHMVTLTDGFWLADTACTQGLWLAVMGDHSPSMFTRYPDLPVENVSWDGVQAFLARLQAYLPSGVEAVLPLEAQWEYACRAGSTTPFSFGEYISTDQVNHDCNRPYNQGPKGKYREETVPVKALPANAWGLYQMHGNVWEWCADALRDYTEAAVTDPSGATGEGVDVYALRGGGWHSHALSVRSARRLPSPRDGRGYLAGFRFALRSTSQQGAGSPVFGGQNPQEEREGPVKAARRARRKT